LKYSPQDYSLSLPRTEIGGEVGGKTLPPAT
jgi:hypothetical protein